MKSVKAYCSFPYTKFKVTSEGNVALCCRMRSDTLGNILTSSFEEIWNGKLITEIRQAVQTNEMHPSCARRGTCQYLFGNRREKKFELAWNGMPKKLEIDLPNTHCNIGAEIPTAERPGCLMCPRSDTNFKPHANLLDIILPKVKFLMEYIDELHIQGIAEPFYKDYVFDMLDQLEYDKFKDKITYITYTNGTLLNSRIRKKFLTRVPKSILRFSIDAGSPEVYQKIRRIDGYEVVIDNLINYGKERKKGQQLHINNNINEINLKDCPEMLRIAKKAKVDGITLISTMSCFEETLDGIKTADFMVNELGAKKFKVMQRKLVNQAKKLGVNLFFVRPLDNDLAPEINAQPQVYQILI